MYACRQISKAPARIQSCELSHRIETAGLTSSSPGFQPRLPGTHSNRSRILRASVAVPENSGARRRSRWPPISHPKPRRRATGAAQKCSRLSGRPISQMIFPSAFDHVRKCPRRGRQIDRCTKNTRTCRVFFTPEKRISLVVLRAWWVAWRGWWGLWPGSSRGRRWS